MEISDGHILGWIKLQIDGLMVTMSIPSLLGHDLRIDKNTSSILSLNTSSLTEHFNV